MNKKQNPYETPEERRLRYVRNRKAKLARQRKRRDMAKKNGTMRYRVLGFLLEIMAKLGLTQKQFALPLGWTQQNINYHFMSDDMLYCDAQKALSGHGYWLEARFDFDHEESVKPVKPVNRYRIEGCITSTYMTMVPKLPDYLEESIQRGSSVAFIGLAIRRSGRSLSAICKEAEIEMTSFRHFIKKNDMRISYLYRLADALGATLVWNVNRM